MDSGCIWGMVKEWPKWEHTSPVSHTIPVGKVKNIRMMPDYRKCQYAAQRRSHTGTVRGGVGAMRLLFTVTLKAALTSSPSAKLADWRTRSSSAMAAITCKRIASMSGTVLPSNRVNACTAI